MEEGPVASVAPALPGGDGAVRVVARICPTAGTTTAASAPAAGTSLFQVAASRGRRPRASGPGAGATLSFTPTAAAASSTPSSSSQGRAAAGQRKEEHRLDWCYLQEETNHHVFLHELHPILAHHLHNQAQTQTTAGSSSSGNACVVACGAAAAKDHLFKGSQEQPGLVTIAMEEILGIAASIGGAVRVSSYQVVQDTHVFDLLEPKEQEVLVLEDAQGKTNLKGLSKVHVKSIEDFTRLGCFDENQDKQQPTKASSTQQQPTKPFSTQPQPTKASSTQLPTRGHQGLIIHISTSDQDGKERDVAKINFLSLSDYVDPKQKTGGGAAALSSSGNKSMYTLMNVVQALNSNHSFVPYRQSKVTRILQDSLCKTSGAVVIACLEEVSCQDAVSTLSLAARSSQVATQVANEQCRRSASVTSFKRADVSLSAVAKSSSRPILSSTHQPNPVVEKQDRPQWNMSAVKAARTPIANKRSQPTMHPAKKSENSLPTPIKITQKAATPTMSARPQPIMHSAKNLESSLSTPIKMPPKDAKPTMSGRSQPESAVSPPTKMKQKDAKPAMSGRSQVMMRSAKKLESSLSASIKTKQKDAKPTATSGSTLLCPSTNSAKEEAAVIAPATVTEVEEVQSSQGMEIDAPSTDEGFDKTSDALDTVSSEIQKVVSGGMEEEDHSSSSLDAASSCTMDLGETCSSIIPDAFVEKTPVKTHMNTPKISDKLREISNSLKLLNARPLSVMAQKVAMEKTQEEGMEKTQKVAMEKTQEVAMETTQEVVMETTQGEGMEATQGVVKEKTQEEGMETTEEVAMEMTEEVAIGTTQEVGMETTQGVAMEKTQEVATGTTQEVAVETAQEVATGMTQEVAAVETAQDVAVETTKEVAAVGTTQEVAALETTQEVAATETTQVAVETTQEVAAVETAQEVAVETAQEVAAVETTQEVAAVETTQEVAVETAQEVAVETTQEVAIETTQEVAVETTQGVAVKTAQEVGMESVQGGTNIDAPEPKTPAMHLKVEQPADPKTPAIHLKFEQAADYPTSSFKTRSTGIKKSIVQECLSFLNSANKEQLKSLKGIGEKRANYIIELREHSPELFKGIDDLRDVIGMNKTEIKKMMSGIIESP
ncbi:hypothetical protein ACQJBY_072601 [Aegilops geniculata]